MMRCKERDSAHSSSNNRIRSHLQDRKSLRDNRNNLQGQVTNPCARNATIITLASAYGDQHGHLGFMLSCYDAEVSYDGRTDIFLARHKEEEELLNLCFFQVQTATESALVTAMTRIMGEKEKNDVKLEKVLKEAAMENKTLILTTLNAAWASPGSIIDLFFQSFRTGDGTRRLLDHLVIIALEAYIRELLRRGGQGFLASTISIPDTASYSIEEVEFWPLPTVSQGIVIMVRKTSLHGSSSQGRKSKKSTTITLLYPKGEDIHVVYSCPHSDVVPAIAFVETLALPCHRDLPI
ncbi:hypothetical protein ZIOFF_068225 [Zingiber officinale]|uniref:Uncharacterized protein n=1 Tax=Zingiber officinale TaxID=94328 RepID=A0A8J5CGS6_ZINOF|nr:hypothetical protein ZIOFF_068225 [Zingiber officinale]